MDCDFSEIMFLVEPMGGNKSVSCTKINRMYVVATSPVKERIKQMFGCSMAYTTKWFSYKHFPQRCILTTDIKQSYCSHYLFLMECNPEISHAMLIETDNILQIRLIINGYG